MYNFAETLMRRSSAILGSVVFLFIAPGFVAGVVPWWITGWAFDPPWLGLRLSRVAGAALIWGGAPMLLDSFVRFALQGLGTPAPVAPPKHLVVTGLYRRVRNPMYVGVLAAVGGQALLFGKVRLVEYAFLLGLAFHLFVFFYEEPTLRNTFGDEYETFCRNVPRWIPRLHPWRGQTDGRGQADG